MARLNLICCVVNIGVASEVAKAAKKYGVKGGIVSRGRGTVASHLLEVLGIHEVRKEIVTIIVEDDLAAEAIKGISQDMEFYKPHHGIAFSLSVGEFLGGGHERREKSDTVEVVDSMYKVIYVIVDKGKAEDVIEAANKAGARGGTIVNARSAGNQQVHKLFSVEIEPQKEEVFIITKSEQKDSIVDSIRTAMKMDEPGNGILFVLDINEAYGLH